MDKLRALTYFMAAAQGKSFSAAARQLEVSVPAIAKLVTALEASLGVRLFERAPKGLTLTAAGDHYLQACAPALSQLLDADEQTRASSTRASGTVVVGVQHVIASGALTSALPRFHMRHPDVTLDIRDFQRISDEETSGIDVFLVMGWPQLPQLVHRRIAAGRFLCVASPDYLARHGKPFRPKDLTRHTCLPIRALDGTVMDLWRFTKGDEDESVPVRSWMLTANSHRDMVVQLALAGEGVACLLDWTNLDDIASGRLVRVLPDWEFPEAPPVNLLFRPSVRRIARVRLFIDFVTELFAQLEARRGQAVAATEAPYWVGRHYGRSSVMLTRQR